jgi:ubiquinone/menaquinone biosynthesis C-methylase UbiE
MSAADYGRGLISAALYRLQKLLQRTQLAVQSAVNMTGGYQPDPFAPPSGPSDRRACAERFAAFAAALPPGPLSCIDIGCNIGYFTFRVAARGGVCIGIDTGRNEISVARGLAAKHGVQNIAFLQFDVTPDSVNALPQADVIVCMSIFHHWARKLGLAQATRIMDGIASRCRFLVFETGQHNETDTSWAKQLSFMGNDCDQWIRAFLTDRGFGSVEPIGEFSTTLSDVRRTLYLARKSR